MKKSVDSTFLHYGVRQEDMQVIVKACQDSGIDAESLLTFFVSRFLCGNWFAVGCGIRPYGLAKQQIFS